MNKECRLSNVTKEYLTSFYWILDEMIQGMTDAKLNNSLSHNFIVQMIPHHRAAIEMSKNILKYTTDISVQEIAAGIIAAQTKSINDMRHALNECSMLMNSPADLCLYQRSYQEITQTMFHQMRTACTTNNINANFMREMIPHHQGAIRMSENALKFEICPELKPILDAIITSQKKGVQKMTCLLKHTCI